MSDVEEKPEGEAVLTISATQGGLFVSAALAAAVVYALVDRGPAQFFRSAGLLSLPFFLAAAAGTAVAWVRSGRGVPKSLQVRQITAAVVLVGLAGGAVYYGLYVAGLDALKWLLRGTAVPGRGNAALVALLATGAGVLLFWFRLRMRALYGVSEVAAGVSIAAWRGLNQAGAGLPGSPEFYFAILTASIYLVVRGLDNVHQGLQSNTDASVAFVRRIFRGGGGLTVTVRKLK